MVGDTWRLRHNEDRHTGDWRGSRDSAFIDEAKEEGKFGPMGVFPNHGLLSTSCSRPRLPPSRYLVNPVVCSVANVAVVRCAEHFCWRCCIPLVVDWNQRFVYRSPHLGNPNKHWGLHESGNTRCRAYVRKDEAQRRSSTQRLLLHKRHKWNSLQKLWEVMDLLLVMGRNKTRFLHRDHKFRSV
jgi:hypothetical protein